MEYPTMEAGFVPGKKRHVREKRISKAAKLNVSLASKIKTKILNNSSIFKISLKHNNRALAQALSREKENYRRITTEKMLLQKEMEKLNFENTFLRLKLNNLNKKLIDIEALMNNNLITAIEMSTLSEFHQSSFLSTSKKKRTSKQSKLIHPFARVPLTSNDDDDDDDDNDKKETQHDSYIISKTSSDTSSSISARQISSTQHNLELLLLEENNKKMDGLDDSEHISSIIDILSNENHCHSDQILMDDMKNPQSIGQRKEKLSVSNITTRKKILSSSKSNNPPADSTCMADLDEQTSNPELNCNNEISDDINEFAVKKQRNAQYFPDSSSQPASGEPATEPTSHMQAPNNLLLQKTVYDADMDLTASEESKIVTVSTGTKNASNNKLNDCKIKTFRKVKYSSSGKKREKPKSELKNADVEAEEMIKNGLNRRTFVLEGKGDPEETSFFSSTEQPTQLNMLKKISLPHDFDPDDRGSMQCNEKKRRLNAANEQEDTYSLNQSSGKFQQESKYDVIQSSVACNKRKANRQTIIIQNFEKGDLFLNQKDKEIISENLEDITEFQTTHLTTKDNANLCDFETQNVLGLKKCITDNLCTQQNELKVNNKLRQKRNRKTKIISETNQINGDDTQDVPGPEKGNIFSLQENKETISDNVEVYLTNVFQSPAISTSKSRKLCDHVAQNLGLPKQITDVCLDQQHKIKVSKTKRKINRKTEIISEVIHQENDKNIYCPEKDSNLLLLKDTEIISENLEDPLEFQISVLSTTDTRNLRKSHSVCGMKKQVHDLQSSCKNSTEIDEKLKQNLCQKGEILKISQINDKDICNSENDNLFSLSQKDDIIPKNLEDLTELENADAFTRANENLSDFEAIKEHVADKIPSKQNKRKINKERQKVSKKRKITFHMSQVHEDNDKDVHRQESYTKNLDVEISKSKQRLECKNNISACNVEINSNEKVNFQISNSSKRDEKYETESLGKAINKPILQLKDSLQTCASESDLRHSSKEADFDPRSQMKPHKSQKRSTIVLNKSDSPFVEMINEEECQVQKQTKTTPKSRKRKTFIRCSGSQEVLEIVSDSIPGISVDFTQANKEKSLENEEIVKLKPNFYTKMFKSLSQIYSPNIQESAFNRVHEDSMPLSISSNTNLILKGNLARDSSQIFQGNDDVHKTTKGVNLKVNQRTKISGVGDKPLQDMTNISFVSNNTDKPKNNSDQSLELSSRKRRCIPVNLKEPSLKGKLRR